MAKSTPDQSSTSTPEICADSRNVTGLQELASGLSSSDAPAGPISARPGPQAVPARHSAPRGKRNAAPDAVAATLSRMLGELATLLAPHAPMNGSPMPATSGLRSGDLPETAALQRSLENRLRALTERSGSPLFELRWASLDMPLGGAIFQQRARARRISGNDSTSWPTPAASNARSGPDRERRDCADPNSTLPTAVDLASWPTPVATEILKGAGYQVKMGLPRSQRGGGCAPNLATMADLATWPTPKASDGSGGRTTATQGGGNAHLDRSARLTGWHTPKATDGSNGGPNQAGGALPPDAALTHWPTPMAGNPYAGNNDSSRKTVSLLLGWATPRANDFKSELTGTTTDQQLRGSRGQPLPRQVLGVGPARLTAAGLLLTGSYAAMEAGGQLSPAHSRWLMDLPEIWDMAAPRKSEIKG